MGRGRPAQAEALSFLLLFGAGLFVRSLQNLETTDTGVALDNLITFAVSPDLNGYDGERGTIFYRQLLERLRSAPEILGQVLSRHTTDRTFTIAGVMPAGFERWRGRTDVWLPLTAQSDFERTRVSAGYFLYTGVGRLKPGAGARSAAGELQALVSALETDRNSRRGVNVVPLRHDVVSAGARAMLAFLAIAALLVWIIACANVGGLIWSRHTDRAPEFAVRMAIGATGWRVARHVAAEAVVIAATGGVFGLAVAASGIRLLLAYSPPALARPDLVPFDRTVAVAAIALILLTMGLIAVVPMAQISRRRLSGLLAEARGQHTHGRRARRLHDVLVAGEVAIAVLVFVCATLVVRSFVRLQQIDLGFTPGQVLSLRVNLTPPSRGDTSAQTSARINQVYDEVRARLAALPGVEGVTLGSELPIPSRAWRTSIWLDDGRRILNGGPDPEMIAQAPGLHFVSPGYIGALGARIVRGRDFTARDRIGSPPVVLVNETMARLLLNEPDALLAAWIPARRASRVDPLVALRSEWTQPSGAPGPSATRTPAGRAQWYHAGMSGVPERLTAAASRIPYLRLLVLHGSRATGTAHERSDWDFAYLADAGMEPDVLLTALVDATGSDTVDIADLDRAGALLRFRVARDGVAVHEAAPGLFEHFRLQAVHTWCDMEPVLTPIYERALADLEPSR